MIVLLSENSEEQHADEEKLKEEWKNIDTEYGTEGITDGIDKAIDEIRRRDLDSVRFGHDLNMQHFN